MVECVGGILSFDVCGVSLGYIGLCTVGGAAGAVYMVAQWGPALGPAFAIASGFAGAIVGFFLGVVTLPILAIFTILTIFALCFAALASVCYFVFIASQQVSAGSLPL